MSFRYKLKNQGLTVRTNKKTLGIVSRFELNDLDLNLDDGFNKVRLPRMAAEREILPKLARLARCAGVGGLERYYRTSSKLSYPGREWKVVTTRGIYVRETFSVSGTPVDTLGHGKRVFELEAKQLNDQLWIRHKLGWSLASKRRPDGTAHRLMSSGESFERSKSDRSSSTLSQKSALSSGVRRAVSSDMKLDLQEKKLSIRVERSRTITDSMSSLQSSTLALSRQNLDQNTEEPDDDVDCGEKMLQWKNTISI